MDAPAATGVRPPAPAATTPELRHAWMIEVKPELAEGAVEPTDEAVAAAPTESSAVLARARLDHLRGRYEEAQAGFSKVWAAEPSNAAAGLGLGQVLLERGRRRGAPAPPPPRGLLGRALRSSACSGRDSAGGLVLDHLGVDDILVTGAVAGRRGVAVG